MKCLKMDVIIQAVNSFEKAFPATEMQNSCFYVYEKTIIKGFCNIQIMRKGDDSYAKIQGLTE